MEVKRKLLMVMAAGVGSGDQKSLWETIEEWLAQLPQHLQDALKYLLGKVQILFPPQSTPEILNFCLRFGVTILLPVTLVLLLVCLFCQCFCWVVEGCPISCCSPRRRRRRKTPKDRRPEDPNARSMAAGERSKGTLGGEPSSQPETPLLSK